MSLGDQLKTLDPNNPGQWPILIQCVAGVVLFIVVIFLGFYLNINDQRTTLASAQGKEVNLKGTFEKKQKETANLDALRDQMKEMEQSFGDMLRQLPNKTEVPGLIVDISQTGLAAGLQFQLFKPEKEHKAEFYAELPINIKVTGTYHQFGEFISGIAALPRIVTTHDIHIQMTKGGQLEMSAVAKTYRALEEGES
jgi:type IV pilus assembly protein PilO